MSDDNAKPSLERALGRWQLTLLGVSNAIGAGVLILTGTMAADYAGPAAALSFLIAGVVCLITALCYAELSAIFPKAGSAYTYAYASFGRVWGWMVGWCLVLGYLVAGSTVAVGWSGYLASFLARFDVTLPVAFSGAPITVGDGFLPIASGQIMNLPAVLAVIVCTLVLLLGVRHSARANTIFVSMKILAIALFLAIGVFFIDTDNWTPFVPPNMGTLGQFGWSGVIAGAVIAFYSYTGFEVISTSAQEARDPQRSVPFALIASFWICVVFYVSVTLVMTGLVPYQELGVPSPVTLAMARTGPEFAWAGFLINALIVAGLLSAILVSLYGQSRIFLVMSADGLLPNLFADVHPRFRTPVFGTLVTGILAAIIAGLVPLEMLGEIVSMGLLVAFSAVCLAVISQRRAGNVVTGGFKVPLYPSLPAAGVVLNIFLIFTLPAATWSRLIAWLAVGVFIYVFYGRNRAAHGATL